MPEGFKHFLLNMQKDSQPEFDFDCFKSCSNEDRMKCANVILQQVIDDPVNVEAYAKLASKILNSHSLKSSVHKTFVMHLHEVCGIEVDTRLTREKDPSLARISAVGVFLSHLYALGCFKSALKIIKWSTIIQKFIERENPLAIRIFFTVLMPILRKIKVNDSKNFAKLLPQLTHLSSEGKIPEEFAEWVEVFLGNDSTASNVSSMNSELSSNLENATGAIKKT